MPFDPQNYLAKKPEASSDTECYPDYWSIGFMDIATGKWVIYERTATEQLPIEKVRALFTKYRIYGFNWWHYDVPMICLALTGASNRLLKQANDDIIANGMGLYKFKKKYGITIPDWFDMIDLFNPTPGVRISLKKYGARMGTKKLAETPFPFDENANTPQRRPLVRKYLVNDLQLTRELRLAVPEEMEQRAEMSAKYGMDLRSKSNAQIAAALFAYEVKKITKVDPPDPEVISQTFRYKAPRYVNFTTPVLQGVLRTITTCDFVVKADDPYNKKEWGVVKLPKEIKDIKLRIGFTDYKMGIGGLHSKEKKRSFISDEESIVVDSDVRGYYPELMIKTGLFPSVVGTHFLRIMRDFVDNRTKYKLAAQRLKAMGDKANALKYTKRSGDLKIVNNGTFGQTGNPYCFLYAPNLMIQTTLTGQLSILMLIERLELRKFSVISANTDGIVTVVPRHRSAEFFDIRLQWETETRLEMEELRYAGVYSRDVNSYIALPHDIYTNPKARDYIKRKGLFGESGLTHDPVYDICSEAVIAWLVDKVPIEDTIYACDDIKKFVAVRQVPTGAYKDDVHLGKMIRWYIGQDERGWIVKANGDRVAGTTGAVPCMDLPDEFPNDIDMEWYVREGYARLDDMGLTDRHDDGRRGTVWASLPSQKTLHIVDLGSRKSQCERVEKEVREAWIEHKFVPNGMRMCKKCQENYYEERGFVDQDLEDEIPF